MFIASLIVIAVLLVGYVATGITIAAKGFNEAKKIPLSISTEERSLIRQWHDHLNYCRRKPEKSLEDFYKTKAPNRKDAALAQAYRRAFWSPVWPLMLAGDVYRGYQKAKAGERVYLLEQSTKALEKVMEDGPELDKTYEKAKAVLEKATAK